MFTNEDVHAEPCEGAQTNVTAAEPFKPQWIDGASSHARQVHIPVERQVWEPWKPRAPSRYDILEEKEKNVGGEMIWSS